MIEEQIGLPELMVKTVVVHTVTYFAAGIVAFHLGNYEVTFSQPPLSFFMRPTTDPWVMMGPVFQPIRGLIFALAFYPLREVLFGSKKGWLTMWWLLVALGILSTFGPAPGSIEGMIYTIMSPLSQLAGNWEVILQSFLLSVVLFYWVTHPKVRWLGWTLGLVFLVLMVLPILGLLAQQA
jgi:hypothetical protein